jgi:hypothetical protein
MNYDDIVDDLIISRVDVGKHTEDLRKLEALKAFLNTIPSEKGKKYALSKFLNETPGYDYKELKASNPNLDEDYWSLKHQDDYTPPDVEKTLEKANKENAENFWNWESDKHWSKRGTDELKRQADRAGYGDNLPGYLDKVREVQTDRDRHNASERFGYNYWGSVFAPRTVEAIQRGEDPTGKDIGLDAAENALYLLNPMGRAVRAGLQGAKAGSMLYKYGKPVATVADIAANPLAMELADAAAYDEQDNTDRKDFKGSDVLLGTGINAGMNKLVPMITRNKDKFIGPVEKSKAQIAAEKAAEDVSELPKTKLQNIKEYALDELRRQRIRDTYPTVENKREAIKFIESELAEGPNPGETQTTFKERIKSDMSALGLLGDYASNKTGDVISEDPKLSRRLISGAARGFGFAPQILGDLVSDYYKLKDKNVEQDKINRDINALKLLGNN